MAEATTGCGWAPQRGFSVVELLTVMAIMMVLSAIGIPVLMNAVYASRIRSAADELSALVQQARTTAEQRNAKIPFYTANVGQSALPGGFISCSSTNCPDAAAWKAGDPYVPYGSGVTNGLAANVPTALNPGFLLQPAGTTLYLTPLGLASNAATGTYTASGFVFYLTDTRSNWAAVSVSPRGKSKVWLYSAGAWH
jgi:prepilin-type N-terminal cleavage/methylation domain-containing protein